MTQPLFSLALVSFGVAVAVAWLLLHTRDLHMPWTADHPDSGPQKIHTHATVRVGGVAIVAGLLAGLAWLHLTASPELRAQLSQFQAGWLIAGAVPLVVLGLVEDISGTISVRLRLGVSLAAGALVWALAGVRVTALGLPLLDDLLVAVPAFSLVFTLVAVGGLVHAMNIVDGLNGLLAGKTLVVLGSVALVAARFNEPVLVLLAVAGMAATAGFAVFNFPHGRMFCGDAGAYLIGYLSAILVVLLVLRQDTLSPWFALAVVIHPVTETLYSAWRRASNGLSATHPDARHMHSLWSARLRTLERTTGQRVWLGSNAGAAWRTLAVAAVPSLLATCWPTHTLALQVLCVAYVAAFIVAVRLLEQPDTEGPSPVTAAPAE